MSSPIRIAAVGEVAEELYLPGGERFLGGISTGFALSASSAGAASKLGTGPALTREPRPSA